MKKLMDQDEMYARRDELLEACKLTHVRIPQASGDVLEDIENLERVLGCAPDAPAGKSTPSASSGSSLADRYAAITDPSEKAAFVAQHEKGLREIIMHGDTPKPGADVLATYNAITDPAERSRFVALNYKALRSTLK